MSLLRHLKKVFELRYLPFANFVLSSSNQWQSVAVAYENVVELKNSRLTEKLLGWPARKLDFEKYIHVVILRGPLQLRRTVLINEER